MGKPHLRIGWNIEVKDKNGKVTFRKSGISRSLLKNFMLWFQSKFQLDTVTITSTWTASDTSNTARTFAYNTSGKENTFGSFGAVVNNHLTGLRIGISDQAVSPNDFEMVNLITHGAGAGQMIYNAQTYEAVAVVGQISSFRITRAFTNNSGGSIGIKEIGAALQELDSAGVIRYVCYLRDVLASTVTVPDGSTFTLRYTFSVTA